MGDSDDPRLARTLEARFEAMPDLARTLVDRPNQTIEPPRRISERAVAALESLRALGATLSGRIDLHETLGEGGMGVVHLGTQATLGRPVAVKTLRKDRVPPPTASAGTDAALRILREAWVTGTLEHPNIVPVHDLGVDESGSPVIVMKRIEGRAWSDLMREPAEVSRRFRAIDLLEWNLRTFMSVCNAVAFAHSRGIIHRDLKPENVMIGEFGEVYVLDWGIALSLRDDPSGRLPPIAQATEVAGTPHYMAPEMLLGDPAQLSTRTDVYLLGAVLYEIFAGRAPHEGDSLSAMLSDILLSSPRYASGFPPEARRICVKAMSREPQQRHVSVEELREAVEEYLRHRGSRRLAHDAKLSLEKLENVLRADAPEADRDLEIANLLGECRFGYHAALSAWPENKVAREGLDRALALVIERELARGDAAAAATLLRDVSSPARELVERVESAARTRADEEGRLRRMETDYDPKVGTRTRSFLTASFGLAWAASTVGAWVYTRKAETVSFFAMTILPSIVYLVLALAAYAWARETLSKTLLNRRLGRTLLSYLVLQALLGIGAGLLGLSWQAADTLFLFAWTLSYAMLSVWVEQWMAVPALACGASFLAACAYPSLLFPSMTADNLIFAAVVMKVWFPRQDLARIKEGRAELRRRARSWLHE